MEHFCDECNDDDDDDDDDVDDVDENLSKRSPLHIHVHVIFSGDVMRRGLNCLMQ